MNVIKGFMFTALILPLKKFQKNHSTVRNAFKRKKKKEKDFRRKEDKC